MELYLKTIGQTQFCLKGKHQMSVSKYVRNERRVLMKCKFCDRFRVSYKGADISQGKMALSDFNKKYVSERKVLFEKTQINSKLLWSR